MSPKKAESHAKTQSRKDRLNTWLFFFAVLAALREIMFFVNRKPWNVFIPPLQPFGAQRTIRGLLISLARSSILPYFIQAAMHV